MVATFTKQLTTLSLKVFDEIQSFHEQSLNRHRKRLANDVLVIIATGKGGVRFEH